MQISIQDIPQLLADVWGITEATAQVLLSVVVMLAVLLPVMYVSRGKRAITIEIVMIFLVECFLVGIGWLPFWILIATVVLLAAAVAYLGSEIITGGE